MQAQKHTVITHKIQPDIESMQNQKHTVITHKIPLDIEKHVGPETDT